MPNEIIPIDGLASVGLIEDMPSVALPPNAFSDISNLRLRDGAIKKFPGYETLKSSLSQVVYACEWHSVNGTYYVVIRDTGATCEVDLYSTSWVFIRTSGSIATTGGTWQHCVFNGGWQLIINNGEIQPHYLEDDGTAVTPLPGWASYTVERDVHNYEFDGSEDVVKVKGERIKNGAALKFSYRPRNKGRAVKAERATITSVTAGGTLDVDKTLVGIGTIGNIIDGELEITPFNGQGGGVLEVVEEEEIANNVTCSVIRSYNNLLVACGVVERKADNTIIRELTGAVRLSDAAAPGDIPKNWNPFNVGVSTADEITLTSVGEIVDMVEMQGSLFIYATDSIHMIQQTGSAVLPFQVTKITDSYGAYGLNSVAEVDGQHIVCGSNDCYLFGGHPGSIQSICDGRTRDFFRNNKDVQVVRYNKYDELWFFASSVIYVWNYRNNTWTKRTTPGGTINSINASRDDIFIAQDTSIQGVDNPSNWAAVGYIERRRMQIPPQHETDTISSVVVVAEGSGTLDINVEATNIPGNITESLTDAANTRSFDIATEYKQDIRETGRYFNYRISHNTSNDFKLTALSLEVGKGGKR